MSTPEDIKMTKGEYEMEEVQSEDTKLTSQDKIKILQLFLFIKNNDEDNFVKAVETIKKNTDKFSKYLKTNYSEQTLLMSACSKGLDWAVKILLENGADPNLTVSKSDEMPIENVSTNRSFKISQKDKNLTVPVNDTRPIALVCSGGYFKILQLLTKNNSTSLEPVNGESLLQIVINNDKKPEVPSPNIDYNKCLNILLEKQKSDINFRGVDYNTALHYAAKSGNQDTALALLKKGACIGVKNGSGELPLADMSAETLKVFLDDCLTDNMKRPIEEDYELKFNYSCLVPLNNAIYRNNCGDSNALVSDDDCQLAPETDALLYMAMNSEFKPLLKHPVITSFLYLKWQRISFLFFVNIIFYAFFWFSLILYILFDGDDTVKIIACLGLTLTCIGLFVLTLREILQFVLCPKLYIRGIENWLELLLIGVTLSTLLKDIIDIGTIKQPLFAITILVSSAEFIVLFGQFPLLSTYVVMLKTVSLNFFKFFGWCLILIIASALSFYTLFKTVKPKKTEGDESIPDNLTIPANNENDFDNPGTSLFKTIMMFTGELDASSINFNSSPVISRIIFIIFVFMISIVLFNLLNGLAISDTQSIKKNAELVAHISRIKLISHIEGILFGDVVPTKNEICKGFYASYSKLRMFCIKRLTQRLCLFPNFLPMAQICVMMNRDSRVVIYENDEVEKKQRKESTCGLIHCCFRRFDEVKIDWKTVKAARHVITERKEKENSEYKKIENWLMACETKLVKFEKLLEDINKSVNNN